MDLQRFDKDNVPIRGSAIWLRNLILELERGLSAGVNQSSLHLAVRKRYGIPILNEATASLFLALFTQWSKEEEDDYDGDELMSKNELDALLQSIRSLGWFQMYHGIMMRVLYKTMRSHIVTKCKDEFQVPFIPELKQWLEFTLVPFLEASLGSASGDRFGAGVSSKKSIGLSARLRSQLSVSLLRALAETRAQELFNIVADYPDSMCAVRELKEAMVSTDTLSIVGKEFKAVVQRRLLHMGASTAQIVGFYVSMIRTLRVLDNSDLLLNFIAAPVRLYLRDRKDTVRCVVSALTEGKGSELHGELRKGGSLEYGPDEDDEDAGPGDHWEPRKRNFDLVEAGGRGLDVLALLVSIYGSTDLFVSDYRSVLADKLLLSNLDYRADQELATLELLKIRFGEEAMHCCEVMLRDLEESRRTNAMLHQLLNSTSARGCPVDCLIVSENYWPALQSDSLSLPPSVAAAVAAYQANYADVKKPRKLHVASQLGLVDIDLQFDDGTVRNFLVTPVQASLIMFLSEGEEDAMEKEEETIPRNCGTRMSISQLASKCELEECDVQRRMGFWIAREVAREISSNSSLSGELEYVIVEDQARRVHGRENTSAAEGSDEVVQMTVGSDVTEKAALAQFETYVKGLLTNHGSMTLERIHTMLKLISGGSVTGGSPKFDMNLVQLQSFLQNLVDQDKLERDGSSEGQQFRIRSKG